MSRWLLTPRRRIRLLMLLSVMLFLRMLLVQLSSSVELDFDDSKRADNNNNERLDQTDYEDTRRQRPLRLAEADDPDRWFRYRPPVQSGIANKLGKRFNIKKSQLSWNIDDLDFVSLTPKTVTKFVVATAASFSFHSHSLDAIATVQRHLPNHTIFFYDLDMGKEGPSIKQMRDACNVEYRHFNFSRYPRHVQYLKNYAWKPLIIAELLTEYPGVLWIDSSIRFFSGNLSVIFEKAIESEGMLSLTSTGHSNFAVTHPQMYSYLLTSMKGMIKTDQHEANCVLLYRTKPAFEKVVWWWMLCALDPLCIAPINRTNCYDPYGSRSVHAKCHRFDQSALNILLANYFAFDYMRYFGSQNVAAVKRGAVFFKGKDKARMCPTSTSLSNFTTVAAKYRT